jgi:2-iminobutanoate/2-iminopropanoate deaminase
MRNKVRIKLSLLIIVLCLLIGILSGCINNQKKEIQTMQRRIINPWTWQDNFGFVQSNEITNANRMLFTAGIVSVDKDGNLLYPGDMEKQINQIFNNLETILAQADFQLSDVVRFTYYTTNVQDFSESTILLDRLKKENCKPATSLIGVASLFHPDCVVEIEAVVAD